MRNWFLSAVCFGLLAFGVTFGFALATDSFLLFGTRVLTDGSAAPDMRLVTSGDRELKSTEIARTQTPLDIVFLGSSRTVFAFDPASPTLSRFRAWNAGLNGSHAVEMAAVLRYIIDRGPPTRRFIWNIDFEEFFRESEPMGDFANSAFAGKPIAMTLARHALSYTALRKSAGGLFGAQPFYADRRGFYHYELRDASGKLGGNDFVDMPTLDEWFPGYMVMANDTFETTFAQRLEAIVGAIRHARDHGAAVDIVMMPTHVARRAMFDASGLQPQFEEWKRRLADALARFGDGVRAIDFCEVGEVALTPFRRGGPLERSPWFFEALHPRPVVGDMVAARLLDELSPLATGRLFGAPLAETAQNARLAADREALRVWEREHPDLMAQIVATVKAHDRRPKLAAHP